MGDHPSLPSNEPVLEYAPNTPERKELLRALTTMAGEQIEIPVVIGNRRILTGSTRSVVMPHEHRHVLATLHQASASHVVQAIEAGLRAYPSWAATPFEDRAKIFLRAADLLAGPWRMRINAACMLGQSKTAHQSEIDAVCELIDFFRFNVAFARQIQSVQPFSVPGIENRMDYRPLEGFVFAISPFNFLSIAVNLATAPALMGNVVLWKPASTAALGAWHCLELLREAGLPDGVISFLPGDGPTQGAPALASEHLAGVHFTGSTRTFRGIWHDVGQRLSSYRNFPRVVGETGGKDFVLVHSSANVDAVTTAIVRGGYEYQGQKCSAVSRVYVPKSMWPALKNALIENLRTIRVGDVRDFSNFMGAVIDDVSFERISRYLELARNTATVLHGGHGDKANGYFIEPTLVQVEDPKHTLMQEEIFGPVVTVWVYDDSEWEHALALVDQTSPYALTGAVFAEDPHALEQTLQRLRFSAGNFYVNDKPTGAVVGQQPFGGTRASGTNDKAGSLWNLMRWTSPRAIKTNFAPPTQYRYPFLG